MAWAERIPNSVERSGAAQVQRSTLKVKFPLAVHESRPIHGSVRRRANGPREWRSGWAVCRWVSTSVGSA